MGAPTKGKRGSVRAPTQFRYHKTIKDTISVQRRRNSVNDDEKHEAHPHLQDFLVVQRCATVDPLDLDIAPHRKPTLQRPPVGILHNPDCARRKPCETTEGKATRRVQFRQVTVRDYAMVLGDHPCCSWGPPVTLGWAYEEYAPLEVDEYEFHHALRRPLRQLTLNSLKRTTMLRTHCGHTEAELKDAVREKDREGLRRSITRSLLPCWRVEDAVESAARKLRRRLRPRRDGGDQPYWREEDELDYSVRSGHSHGRRSRPILKGLGDYAK